jgi:uncharacterized membrane protein
VTARFLLAFFDSAYVLALTAWVGSVLFLSFGVAPLIFKVLGAEAGGRFVRALFPRYYAWGAISGAIALPSFLGVPLSFPEYRGPMVAVQAILILSGILTMLYAGNTLTPAINAARDAGPAGHARFERLHRRSVRLNGLVLAIGVGLLIAYATRPGPRTSGIAEMTPAEREQYDARISRVMASIEARQAGGGGTTTPDRPGAERFPIDEATIRELVEIYTRRRGAGADRPRVGEAPVTGDARRP